MAGRLSVGLVGLPGSNQGRLQVFPGDLNRDVARGLGGGLNRVETGSRVSNDPVVTLARRRCLVDVVVPCLGLGRLEWRQFLVWVHRSAVSRPGGRSDIPPWSSTASPAMSSSIGGPSSAAWPSSAAAAGSAARSEEHT